MYLDIDMLYKHCLSIQYPHACIFGVSVFIQPFMKGGPLIRTRGAHRVVLKGCWMEQNVTTCQPYSEFHAGPVFSNVSSQYIFGNCLTYLWTNFSILFLLVCFQSISKHPQPHTPPALLDAMNRVDHIWKVAWNESVLNTVFQNVALEGGLVNHWLYICGRPVAGQSYNTSF